MRCTPLLYRVALLLLVLLLFATPGAWDARPAAKATESTKTVEPAPANLFGRVLNLLATFWAKEGGHIDPNGLYVSSADTGGHIDPDGLYASSAEVGGHIDPDGNSHP
jgi:hypothetical protein